MSNMIKLFDPVVRLEEKQAVLRVLNSHSWASGAGTGEVLRFENEFRKYVNSDSCVAVNSGTSALNLALSLYDLKNKEVIVPSLTFVATVHAIIINGAKPIFVDVDPHTLCVDPNEIRKAITKKTKAVLPVHFAGMACNMNEICEICDEHNLILIEDAAHAAGTMYKGKRIGAHGNLVCFSFHPVKNLGMPTGGLISINDKRYEKFKEILFSRRWCGITNRNGPHYDVKELGWNYYMNEFSAAIGLAQLKKLDKMNKIRKKIAKKYDIKLNMEKIPYNDECSYHIYWILVKNRKEFMEKMSDDNIETGIHYRPIHKMSMYNNYNKSLPITEKAGKHIVSIPIHPNLSENDVDKIINSVNRFV